MKQKLMRNTSIFSLTSKNSSKSSIKAERMQLMMKGTPDLFKNFEFAKNMIESAMQIKNLIIL